jgi:pimeloyl-ACP methyl ester carboxylesterase
MKPATRYLSHLIIIFFALGTHANPVQAQAVPPGIDRPGFSPFEHSAECPVKIPAGYTVECGMVTVPEDHNWPDSPSSDDLNRLELAIAIVHSVSDDPAPDPVLFIDGGPGGRTLDSMSFWLEAVKPLLARRDVIFFDQRGTGYSKPALECPEIDPRVTDPLEAYRLVEPLIACRDRLAGLGIDLGAYTSAQNAADIAVLREALGYEEWNLYGVSYGARVALTVMRDHPQGVRSVVLDALTPVDADLLLEDAAAAKAALQMLFAACQADFVCRTVYPDLELVYTDLVNDLAANPVTLQIVNSHTGESRIEVLNGLAFNGAVLDSLAMPQTSGVPGLIYDVRAGNYEPIIASMESAWESQESDPELRAPIGLQMAVLCNEEAPFVTPGQMVEMLAAYPADVNFLAALDEVLVTICQVWGVGPADPVEDAPVSSSLPVLVLAGEYDAARSPTGARRAAETLANSTVVEFPGAGHSVVLAGACPLDVMERFLDDPNATPDASCVAEMDRPHFFMTVTLTRPIARVVAAVAGVVGLSILLYAGIGLGRLAARGKIAWRVALRRVGWRPVVVGAVLSGALYLLMPVIDLTYFYERSLAQAIAIIGPIVMSIQTPFLVAPGDEPGLEMVLACPRRFHWLAIERVAIALAGHSLVAIVTIAIGAWALGEQHIPVGLVFPGWIASVLFLSGLAAFVSVRTRRATMGVLIALLAWFVFGLVGSDLFDEALLPATPLGFSLVWPRPFDLIQPLVWMAHPFLRPDSLTIPDFVLNRVIVGALGLGLMARAAGLLADTERVLLGRSRPGPPRRTPRRRLTILVRAERRLAVHTRLAQLMAMVRYELLMGWRRGTLRAILLSVLLFPQMLYLIGYLFGTLGDEQAIASLTMWPEAVLLLRTDAAIVANVTTLVMVILLLPLVLAELIPLDRQYRVREIMDTLPITPNVYLAGKLLSAWPVIVGSLVLSALLSGALAWVQNGPYRIGTLAAFWITGVIPLALFSSQMGVMLPVRKSHRRSAILMGLAAVAASVGAYFVLPTNGFVFAALFQMGLKPEQIVDPSVLAAVPGFPNALSLNTVLRIAGVALIMAAVWIITARVVQREREGRRQEDSS